MKLVPEIIDKTASKEFRRFLEATGKDKWERKIAKIGTLPKFPKPCPNLYLRYIASRNPLAQAVARYLEMERAAQSVWKHLTPELMKACGHLKVINAILHNAPAGVSSKLTAMLVDDDTARAFLFEAELAIHFFGLGYDVQFIDLEDKGTYDLLVSDGTYALEVECKTKSADAGRKITRGNFYLLCDVLVVRLAALKERLALLVKCEGRLSARQELFQELAEEVRSCLSSGRDGGRVDNLEFRIVNLPQELQVKSNPEAAAALAPYWSPDAHYFVFSNGTTLIVGCESTAKNRVLKAIYEELKHAANQLSKTRPAMLACFIEDVDDEDWEKLRADSGLARMTHRLLVNPVRDHINFVAYSSDRTAPKQHAGITSFSTTNLRFDNPNPKFPIPKSFVRARQ